MNTKSGPHPSLHQQSGEVREVQFLIEQECEHPLDSPTNLREYPAAVFVEWPPLSEDEARLDAPGFRPCGSRFYFTLSDQAARKLGYNPQHEWLVCEHMGRLIE